MYPGLSKEAHFIEDRFEVLKSQYMKKVVAFSLYWYWTLKAQKIPSTKVIFKIVGRSFYKIKLQLFTTKLNIELSKHDLIELVILIPEGKWWYFLLFHWDLLMYKLIRNLYKFIRNSYKTRTSTYKLVPPRKICLTGSTIRHIKHCIQIFWK